MGRRLISLSTAAAIVAVSTVLALFASSNPSSALVAEVVEADIRVTGSVEDGPPGGGITTRDEMRYRITIRNQGPDAVPARSILLSASVNKAGGGLATVEVSRFNGPLIPAPNGDCGVGRRQVILCTNRQEIRADQEITLSFGHRHPAAEAGQLAFAVTVSPRAEAYIDSRGGNNSFQGPGYVFEDQPTTTTVAPTTTTLETTSTTSPDSATSVDPNESTTSSTDESSTTVAETTTTLETTTTTLATTTLAPTTLATTTTTLATTTLAPLTTLELSTTIDAMVDDEATLVDQASVLGATEQVEDPAQDEELVLGPSAESDGGPPLLLLVGIFAVLLLIGGVGLALYSHYNRPPPLVDIRQYR